MKGELDVELDNELESVEAVVRFKSADKTRYLPFQISYTGEKESLILETMDDNLDDMAIDSYRRLIVRAIDYEANKIRTQRTSQKPETHHTVPPTVAFKLSSLTREERIAQYAQTRKRIAESRKTRGIAGIQAEPMTNRTEIQQQEDVKGRIKLLGAEIDNITKLLEEERIEVISPEELLRRLQKAIEVAKVNKQMLGKRVNMDNYGEKYKNINLRQLNWVLESRVALRIYLEDQGEGTFVFRGVYNKKGEGKQTRYIGQIVRDIMKEKMNG